MKLQEVKKFKTDEQQVTTKERKNNIKERKSKGWVVQKRWRKKLV